MVIFGQRDYSVELGTGTGALISQYGCAETAIASLLVNCFHKDTDPIKLNNSLISVNGYASNGAGAFDLIEWGKINSVYSDITLAFNHSYPSSPADLSLLDSQLQKGFSVVTGVSFNHNVQATEASHYVEIYQKNGDGTYQMRDPWFKDDTVFDNRYAVNGMSVAQCILQMVSYNGPTTQMAQITQGELDQVRADRDKNWQLYQGALTDAATKQTQIALLNSQVEDLKNQLAAKAVEPPVAPVTPPTPSPLPVVTDATGLVTTLRNDINMLTGNVLTLTNALQQIRKFAYANFIVWDLSQNKIRQIIQKTGV